MQKFKYLANNQFAANRNLIVSQTPHQSKLSSV